MKKPQSKIRKIPIIRVIYKNEIEFNHLTQDERFTTYLYEQAWDAIVEGIKNKSQQIYLCEVGGENQYISIKRNDWKTILSDIQKRYEETQDFDKCSECVSLINQL